MALVERALRPARALDDRRDPPARTASSKLPGVATVIIAGERRHAMRMWIDNVTADRHQPDDRRGRAGARRARTSTSRPAGSRATPRVHRAHARRGDDRRGVRRAGHRRARRRAGPPAATSRASRSGRRTTASFVRFDSEAGGRARHRAAVEGEHASRRGRRAAGGRPAAARAARRRQPRRRLRPVDLHPALGRRRDAHDLRGHRCWSSR